MRWELFDGGCVGDGHGEWLNARVEQQREVRVRHDELAQRALDGDLPGDGRAQQDAVGAVRELAFGVLPQAFIAAEKPQGGMRVEQQLQRAPNASAISSGSSSKSSAKWTRPRSAPWTVASAFWLATGTRRATGLPFRAMMMSSPASARSTSCESLVL